MSITTQTPAKKTKKDRIFPIAMDGRDKIYMNLSIPKSQSVRRYKSNSRLKPIPLLNTIDKQRSATFISGVSGSGKSLFARDLIRQLLKIRNSETPVILFTQTIDLDPAFEDFENLLHICISTDTSFLLISPEDLQGKIVIFDDFETAEKNVKQYASALIKDMLTRGRKMMIDAIIITHQTQNYNFTRDIIFECDSYCIFPSSNPESSRRFIETFFRQKKETLERMVEGEHQFDFLFIHKKFPEYYIKPYEIRLL